MRVPLQNYYGNSGYFSIQMTVTGGIIYGNTRLYIVAVGTKTNALSLILHRISFHQDTGSDQVTALKTGVTRYKTWLLVLSIYRAVFPQKEAYLHCSCSGCR